MLKKIGKGILIAIGYFFALWPITVPLIIWIAENNNLDKVITFNFEKATTFIKGIPIELSVASVVVIACITVTLIINIHLKKKYKTNYFSYWQKQSELREKEAQFEKLKNLHEKHLSKQEEELDERRLLLDEREAQQVELLRKDLSQSLLYDFLRNSMTYSQIASRHFIGYNRLYHYIYDELHNARHDLISVTIEAKIRNPDGKVYNTTLNSCDCPDFQKNLGKKEPCKHMYMLAYELSLLNDIPCDEIKTSLAQEIDRYMGIKRNYESTKH